MLKSEIYVLYARKEYKMMSRANLISMFRMDVQQYHKVMHEMKYTTQRRVVNIMYVHNYMQRIIKDEKSLVYRKKTMPFCIYKHGFV